MYYNTGLHLKTCAPTWQQSWVVAFMAQYTGSSAVIVMARCCENQYGLQGLAWWSFQPKAVDMGFGWWALQNMQFFGFLPYRAIRQ